MRLPDEYDNEPKMSASAIYATLGVTLFVAAVLVLVLVTNNKDGRGRNTMASQPVSDTSEAQNQPADGNAVSPGDTAGGKEEVSLKNGSGLTPDDFDFWDLYPEEPEQEPEKKDDSAKEEVSDPATDGRHTKITYADGKEEWVLISPYLPKHEYDFTRLVCQSDRMKYYENCKQVSYVGVDV